MVLESAQVVVNSLAYTMTSFSPKWFVEFCDFSERKFLSVELPTGESAPVDIENGGMDSIMNQRHPGRSFFPMELRSEDRP